MTLAEDDRRHLADPVNEARLERQWAAIRDARPGFSQHLKLAVSVVALALLVGGVGVFVASRTSVQSTSPDLVVKSSREVQRIELRHGAVVEHDSTASLRVTSAKGRTEVQLDAGRAQFRVPPGSGREFHVVARNVRVVVRGTRFEVAVQGADEVRVSVERGEVEVQRNGEVTTLRAPATWSSRRGSTTARASTPDALSPGSASADASAPSSGEQPVPPPEEPAGARELFDRAESARFQGDTRAAAAALDELVRRYPGDPRAGLAAFQLARLKLYSLGDTAGALQALDTALRLSPSASFRADAEARRVEALERLGRLDQCRAARDRYLERYPSGLHRSELEARCGTQPR